MGFLRNWDSSCPITWDSWTTDGANWVIRDLRPEDDKEAVKILLENLCTDEKLCYLSNFVNDPVSVKNVREFWLHYLGQRMSLGCYEEKGGQSKLVALNVCIVNCRGDKAHDKIEGEAWNNVYKAMEVCSGKVDVFKLLDLDMVLHAYGLVVKREYRGARLGAKLLAAREPLALHHSVRGTSTVFSGPAAQKSAERVGFTTAATITLKDLADAGLDYPKDDKWIIKLMVKKYD